MAAWWADAMAVHWAERTAATRETQPAAETADWMAGWWALLTGAWTAVAKAAV
jgi:hypothetical protein